MSHSRVKACLLILAGILLTVPVMPGYGEGAPIAGINGEIDMTADATNAPVLELEEDESGVIGAFKKFVTNYTMPEPLDWDVILVRTLLATLFGFLIAFVNYLTHTGDKYETAVVHSLILITIVSSIIINVIGNNFVRALGLFGALSFIRFRTTLGDAKDTAVFFFSVAVGISTGLGYIAISIVGMAIVFPVLWIMKHIPVFNYGFVHIKFTCQQVEAAKTLIGDVLVKHKWRYDINSVSVEKSGDNWIIGYQVLGPIKNIIVMAETVVKENEGILQYSLKQDKK